MTTCIGANPNPDLFICQDGGWLPKDHPAAQHAAATPSTSDWQPPTADEFEDVETYPGSGLTAPVLVRTARSDHWFVDGRTYRHPYGFVARVEGVALRQFEGQWRWCHRLVITETVGDPAVGHVLYARVFAPRNGWEVR